MQLTSPLYRRCARKGCVAATYLGVWSARSVPTGVDKAVITPILSSASCSLSLSLNMLPLAQKRKNKVLFPSIVGANTSTLVSSVHSSSFVFGKRQLSHSANPTEAAQNHIPVTPVSSFSSSTSSTSTSSSVEKRSSLSSSPPSSKWAHRSKNWQFSYRPRWKYSAPFRSSTLTDYIYCKDKCHAVCVARTYRHRDRSDITVSLIPLRHLAHPMFYSQVDALCGQHESVLMEGRTPLSGAPFSTLVPPRDPIPANQRPIDHEDDEGWEPRAIEDFFQPFSWGVKNSSAHTVIHAADKYDYECLPWYCSLRFNIPLLGSFEREKHCLNMIPSLVENGYKSFAIPWGAGHMCIFHEMLMDNGFDPVGMCSLLMFNRIDGEHSEAQLLKMQSYEKRIVRRVYLLYIVGALMFLYVLSNMFEVELSGPSKRLTTHFNSNSEEWHKNNGTRVSN